MLTYLIGRGKRGNNGRRKKNERPKNVMNKRESIINISSAA